MRDIQVLFDDYASYHQTKGNKWFHRLGIPMIMLTLLGLLARVNLVKTAEVEVDLAMLLIVAASIYYLMLDWRLGIAMVVISVAFYAAGAALSLAVNLFFFILGWIFQFIGHSVYEKRQPAFFRNFVHLLVGPLWILNDLLSVVKKPQRT